MDKVELDALADLLAKVLPYPLKRSGYVVLCRTKGSGAILVAETDEIGVEMWDAIVASVNFLRDNLPAIIEQREALERQSDNIAFILDHVSLPEHLYCKFQAELAEDRAALNPTGEA